MWCFRFKRSRGILSILRIGFILILCLRLNEFFVLLKYLSFICDVRHRLLVLRSSQLILKQTRAHVS
ncbi:uncharacterized protein BX663DRAFT_476724 [Cokeromyces recurvatus]|uniref:uncharacterized protein n=1 Tax=Cokeromyces recurvatus TaxID=90255 RepID=UPI00221FE637|nr:uncharacterized protein BX663DRAFT_476724 [Cokeromyces recurvatus]KAI7900690.1 hypothetical protein BX663DRAFT_476724 [Cokeromyces recurvatus]